MLILSIFEGMVLPIISRVDLVYNSFLISNLTVYLQYRLEISDVVHIL